MMNQKNKLNSYQEEAVSRLGMVALVPVYADAVQVASQGVFEPSTMHCTVAGLGDITEFSLGKRHSFTSAILDLMGDRLNGGITLFTESVSYFSTMKPSLYAKVVTLNGEPQVIETLEELRRDIVQLSLRHGLDVPVVYRGDLWHPHMTVAYSGERSLHKVEIEPMSINFDGAVVSWGNQSHEVSL